MCVRDLGKVSLNRDFPGCVISYSDVVKGYYYMVDYFTQSNDDVDEVESILPGMRDENLLVSAVNRQHTFYGGIEKWNDDFERMASLFFGFVKNHAFYDGNKRISLLVVLLYLIRINRWPKCRQSDLEELTVSVAGSSLYNDFPMECKRFDLHDPDFEVKFIAEFLRKRTRIVDSKYRSITFRELEGILKNYGFYFGNKNDNKIDLLKRVEVKKFLGFGRPRFKEMIVGKIPFPGMSRQISKGNLKHIRELTKLTIKDGIDSHVFYGKTESVYGLISDFEGPLRRLKDK